MSFKPSLASDNARSLWGIAWVCFFWSVASVMVFSILPSFLTEVLNVSKKEVGAIEGIAVSLAFIAKIFSGVLSDFWKSRKPLIIWGTLGNVVTKSLFALSITISWVFWARALDRLSKGIRSGPTDALIADLSPEKKEGESYGMRQALYVLGSVCGTCLASFLMYVTHHNYRFVFWLSLIPTFISLIILLLVVQPGRDIFQKSFKKKWSLRDINQLPAGFWMLLCVTFFLMLARFSEAFLNMRARECGWSIVTIPLLMGFYEVAHAALAWPIGYLADRFNRTSLLLMGILVLTFTNGLIITIPGPWGIVLGMVFAGIHMGMTQGLIAALIAEATLPHLRGTAFSLYYLTTGIAVLIGNYMAGWLSEDIFNSTLGAFGGGALCTTLSAIILVVWKRGKFF